MSAEALIAKYIKIRAMEEGGTTPHERDNARRIRHKWEVDHPGLLAQAQDAWRAHKAPPPPGPMPTPPPGPAPGPAPMPRSAQRPGGPRSTRGQPRAHQEAPRGPEPESGGFFGSLFNRAASGLRNTIDQLGAAISLQASVKRTTQVDITANQQRIRISVSIPLSAVTKAMDEFDTTPEEYAGVVGMIVGQALANAFARAE